MRPRRLWLMLRRRTMIIVSALAIYISVTGLFTFSLFITEESIQTAMFGTWQAIDARDWDVVKFGADRIRNANQLLKAVNYSVGWIQPLSFLAYRAYGHSTDAYLKGLDAKIFANAPELFDGSEISTSFTPQEVRETPEGFLHINRRVSFLSKEKRVVGVACPISGIVSVRDNRILITEGESTHRAK